MRGLGRRLRRLQSGKLRRLLRRAHLSRRHRHLRLRHRRRRLRGLRFNLAGLLGAACFSCGGNQFCTAAACAAPAPRYQGTVLVDGQAHPFAVVVDDAFVYWTDVGNRLADGAVMKAAKAGGPAVALASGQAAPYDLALLDGYLFWGNSGRTAPDASGNVAGAGIMKVSVSGGAPVAVVQGGSPLRLAASHDGVFWTNQDGTVRRAGLDGANLIVLASGQRPLDLALDSSSVYWTNGFQATDPAEPREVRKVPLMGGAGTTIASRSRRPSRWTFVYWTTEGGLVRKAPISGGAVVTLAAGQNLAERSAGGCG